MRYTFIGGRVAGYQGTEWRCWGAWVPDDTTCTPTTYVRTCAGASSDGGAMSLWLCGSGLYPDTCKRSAVGRVPWCPGWGSVCQSLENQHVPFAPGVVVGLNQNVNILRPAASAALRHASAEGCGPPSVIVFQPGRSPLTSLVLLYTNQSPT